MSRNTFVLLVVFAVAMLFAAAVIAAEVEGNVVKAGDGKLTITDKDKKEHSCNVSKDTKISCDGKACKLDDLKKGVKVKVTVEKDTAVKIEASTK
jgi:biopolymer transport protein ExbD